MTPAPHPNLKGANPHTLDDRKAMGLPAHWVERSPVDFDQARRDVRHLTAGQLVATAEDPSATLAVRIAAGSELASVGDPRITPFDPSMVHVRGGSFVMGLRIEDLPTVAARWANVGVAEEWIRKECPAHEVTVESFSLMRYLITHLEWREFLRNTARPALPASWRFGAFPQHEANHPVWGISADDADAYAEWLSARTGRAFRLPSEAEWEFAASGGDGRTFPWGDTDPDADLANLVEDGPLTTTPIGCYPAGAAPCGALDLAGNVEEYVADHYRPYPGANPVLDDLARQGKYRIARGGSFTRFADLARVRRRHGSFPRTLYAVGFRLAESTS